MKKELIKVDKNGTEYYGDFKCNRCGGLGGLTQWPGYTCFECLGTGRSDKQNITKVYTPEYRAILDARAANRTAKKKALENPEAHRTEWLQANQFTADGITHVFTGDTYRFHDQLKAAGAKYNEVIGWHAAEEKIEFASIACKIVDLAIINEWGKYEFKADAMEFLEKGPAVESKHIGEIGSKIELKVWIDAEIPIKTKFGNSYIYKMVDSAGNILTWFTSSMFYAEDGQKGFQSGFIKATVKEHTIYNGDAQTVITRVKAIKGE